MAESKSPYAVFCEMLRHPSAKPLVARAQNFVQRFPEGLSRYDAAEKVHDFLTKCEKLMFSEIVVFEADADEQGRLNACEGLEKMILCKMYSKMFEIDPGDAKDDVELSRHMDGLAWVETKHLGIPDVEISLWPRLLEELRRMNDYKAPADKLTCVVNACHVINDVLKRTQAELGTSRPLSADDFLPLLILAVIKANPPRFHSNVEFICAFRHPSRLNGEHSYWITMLMSAKEFVRQADSKTLDISAEDYSRLYAESLKAADDRNDGYATEQVAPAANPSVAKSAEDKDSTQQSESKKPSGQPALLQEQQHVEVVEKTLLQQKEVLVYQIPVAASPLSHKALEWQKEIWRGPCTVASKGNNLAIRMIDKASGHLFAECLVPANECQNYVEPAIDSSQHFALKITNGEKQALIGLGFDDKAEASNFQSVLQDFGLPTTLASSRPHEDNPASLSALDGIDFDAVNSPSEPATKKVATQQMPQQENRQPSIGDLVEIVNEDAPRVTGTVGMRGTIIENDYSDMPYKVSLPYGDQCWYKPDWVRILAKEAPYAFLDNRAASPSPCFSEKADPFAEFVDMMKAPDLQNTRIPVAA